MDLLGTFFEVNQQAILFVYGQVFFVLGLGIALQSRRYSRLDLARSLSWLAAFGITHGLHEWGDLFIPLQRVYLSPGLVQALEIVHLVLLAVSFTFLLEFGVMLLRPLGYGRWLHGLYAGLLVAWTITTFAVWLPLVPDGSTWRAMADSLARYGIGLPGGLLAAYGLYRQTRVRIAPLRVPHIVSMLNLASVLLALYGLFGGLLPPAVPFFPGNVLNTATFQEAIGVPPLVFRSLIGLGLAVTFIRALEVFEVETERLIEAMEQRQILAAERDRIGRELHDGAIQTVYTAGLLVESARKLAAPESALAGRLDKALAVLQTAIRDLRRNLDELRNAPAGESLPRALRGLAGDPRFSSLLDVTLDLDMPEGATLSGARTQHVLAITNEALSNAIRHARARHVAIRARQADGRLHVVVQDDGAGLPGTIDAGFGLRNMRDRARLLGGEVCIDGADGKGTAVTLDVPWDER